MNLKYQKNKVNCHVISIFYFAARSHKFGRQSNQIDDSDNEDEGGYSYNGNLLTYTYYKNILMLLHFYFISQLVVTAILTTRKNQRTMIMMRRLMMKMNMMIQSNYKVHPLS